MKNGILMEVKKGKAVLLTKDGCFITVKVPRGKHPVVGMEYSVSSFSKSRTRQFIFPSLSLTIAALLILVLFSGVSPLGRNDNTVAAYVSFDVNPSLEAGVNKDLQVIKVKAYNAEGREILQSLKQKKNISLSHFASALLNAYDNKGYLKKNPDVMIGTTIVNQNNDKLLSALDETVSSIKRNASIYNSKAAIMVKNINTNKRNVAQKNGVSSGKYMMYLDAKRKDKNISLNQVKNMSYTELKRKIKPVHEEPEESGYKKNHSEKILRNHRNLEPIKIKTSSLHSSSLKEHAKKEVKEERIEPKLEPNNKRAVPKTKRHEDRKSGRKAEDKEKNESKKVKPHPSKQHHEQPMYNKQAKKNTNLNTAPKQHVHEKNKHENHKWNKGKRLEKREQKNSPVHRPEKTYWKKVLQKNHKKPQMNKEIHKKAG
ncbi:anti-sigma factor domain-containing protein [Fictibacillus sp. FJAT-27399]|uniref:anti-sigma factor domain-containing protein n=1 Tax=Fictibacillus sp. FJAT-27399 TaxID=1729689 RepID=UPI000783018D|nr:anti-sigma factor domain-containing protein [Fictibacillus sp. FJAT-27399]